MVWGEAKNIWRRGDLLTRLVIFHVLVFAAVMTWQLLVRLGLGAGSIGAGSGEGMALATSWRWEILRERPWSVFTHVFVHADVWHLAFNMLLLWWMGQMFQQELGARKLLAVYLAGGWAGWLFYALMLNAFPGLRTGDFALGASAAVMAVLVAVATHVPERRVHLILLGPVALKYIALVYVLLDYFALGNGENAGGNLAHLGGALFGYVWAKQWQLGRDLTRWLERILDPLFTWSSWGGGMRVVSGPRCNWWKRRPDPGPRVKSDEDFNLEKREREARLDAILDKIARHGYDRLSAEEKDFLFRQSNKS